MTTTDESAPDLTEAAPDGPRAKSIPAGYLVTHDKAVVIVQGVIDDTDPSDLHIKHWVIRNESMNPLAFNTGADLLGGATWETSEEALDAAEKFVLAWSEMRTMALNADNVLRNLDLPGATRVGHSSAFPPGVGGEVIE